MAWPEKQDIDGAILSTLGVTSLYTNISNQEGLVAVADKLRADPKNMQGTGIAT